MRAAVLRDGVVVVRDTEDPTPGDGQILVRTLACGICASDLHFMDHPHADADDDIDGAGSDVPSSTAVDAAHGSAKRRRTSGDSAAEVEMAVDIEVKTERVQAKDERARNRERPREEMAREVRRTEALKASAAQLAIHEQHKIVTASYGGLTPITRAKGGPLDPVLAKIAYARSITEGQVLQLWLRKKGVVTVTYVHHSLSARISC